PRGATPGVPVAEEDDDPAPVGRLLHLAREEFVGDNALPGERMRPQVLVLDLVPGQVHVALGVCEVPTGLYTAERHPHRRRIRPRVAGGFLPRGLRVPTSASADSRPIICSLTHFSFLMLMSPPLP